MIFDLNKTYIEVLKKHNILILGASLRSGVSIANIYTVLTELLIQK